jgi:succinyl-CoA synthetase beta subunit
MNLHEYQAKEVLLKYGMMIPDFAVASSLHEVREILNKKGWHEAVVKIQVHAGGRGKAGGVKIGKSPDEVVAHAEKLLGMKMVNHQTGSAGAIAEKVLITPLVSIKKEYYISCLIDRETARPVLIASPEGGMDIEEVAEKHPEKILQIPFHIEGKIRSYHLVELAKFMGWKGDIAKQGMLLAKALVKAFCDTDASLLEINPLIVTKEDQLVVLDAKLSIDDNALFRQNTLSEYYDPSQVSLMEREAAQHELAYIALEGDIGCMVNGAGLAMATMDIIHHFGGRPANFLDVGGGATKEKVAAGFQIILSDPHVKAILVNIFGGIMNCATIAEGVIAAASDQEMRVPLVVRLEGTNVAEGRRLLNESGLAIIAAEDLSDAAKKVVHSAKKGK